jgi:hypothetical protein
MCNPDIVRPIWNSLEIVKLIIAGLTPLLVVIFAFIFDRRLKRHDKAQWTNQKIIEKRIIVYDKVVPKLNDLFCFYLYIGNWKELFPDRVIEIKRELDKDINIYAPLFNKELLTKYNDFIKECFETFTGWGKDATIKSLFIRRKQCNENWNDKWNDFFSTEYIRTRKDNDDQVSKDISLIKEKYLILLEEFKINLEIYKTGIFHDSDVPNINFK